MKPFLFAQQPHAYVWGTETHYIAPAGCGGAEEMPLLIKRIAAETALSVQVHPDDACAARHGYARGKTEAWFIDACKEGAYLVLGLRADETPESVAEAIAQQRLEALLNRVPVRPGEAYLVPAGRIHAIGAGVSLYEVQQNIALTYRLYDYGRIGQDGRPRELHVARALEAARLSGESVSPVPAGKAETGEGCSLRRRAACAYFVVDELDVPAERVALARGSADFEALLVTRGQGTLCGGGASLALREGDCAYLPAQCGRYTLSGRCACLRIRS